MLVLPEEVLDRIFSHLDQDMCVELRKCALAGRSLAYLSRRHIPMFKDVWAHDGLSLFKLRQCTSRKNSTVRHHITSLSITDDSEAECPDFSGGYDVTDILSACENIVRLDLQFIYLEALEMPTLKNVTYLRLADITIYSPMHVVTLLVHFPVVEIVKLCRLTYRGMDISSGSLPLSVRCVELRLNGWRLGRKGEPDQLITWMASTRTKWPRLLRFNVYDVGIADVDALKVVLRRLVGCVVSLTMQEGRTEVDSHFAGESKEILDSLAWYRDYRGVDVFRRELVRA